MSFLTDGYQALIAFNSSGGVPTYMKEKEVQPPDIDGGGEIDTTTMRNVVWRTRQPKHLKTLGNIVVHVEYDSATYVNIVSAINVNQTITVSFPDGHTLTFWGWVNKFTPTSLKEGEFPTAELQVICSNQTSNNVESGPVYV